MRSLLRRIFSFALSPFESGSGPYAYKQSHRLVLVVMGVLFSGLALGVLFVAQGRDLASLFPALVFGAAGVVALIVGALGSDRAVAKIWGNARDE